jgi:hypothetical protein
MPTTSKKQCTILQYIKGHKLEETAGKLAVVDGLSINAISESEFVKASYLSKGLQLPKIHHQ